MREMSSAEVGEQLVKALEFDVVGPGRRHPLEAEVLSQAPSRWYLIGFLVPFQARPEEREDPAAGEQVDGLPDIGAPGDEVETNLRREPALEPSTTRSISSGRCSRNFVPSSTICEVDRHRQPMPVREPRSWPRLKRFARLPQWRTGGVKDVKP
jgi:hypothetical protein